MATKASHLQYDRKYFDLFFEHLYPEAGDTDRAFAIKMFEQREIQIDAMNENIIIALNPGLTSNSVDCMDFSDGSDAKKSVARIHSSGSDYGCNISNVSTKVGPLRAILYNWMLDKFYFFLIPFKDYHHIKKTSNIEIPFFVETGEPKRSNHWWKHEVKSLKELAIYTTPEYEITKNIHIRADAKPADKREAYLNKFRNDFDV